MILILTTKEHSYTHRSLWVEPTPDVRVLTYNEIFRAKSPRRATYIFTDLDRLPAWQLHEAALLYRRLSQTGSVVLNDPARFLGRFGVLRALHSAGINRFNAYRADEQATPVHWPVFLRMEGNHGSPLSDLLHDEQQLDSTIARLTDQGVPRSALLIIEYASEPIRPGLFRRLSVFRVGDRLLGYTSAHDDQWIVKYGKPGIAPPELYEEEYELVSTHRYADAMRPVFDIAGIDYGRVDFGIVDGVPQVYEINSNPYVTLQPPPAPVPRRNESTALFRLNYLEAMTAIDTPVRSGPGPGMDLDDMLAVGLRKARRMARSGYHALRRMRTGTA